VVDVVVNSDDHNTLEAAVLAADLAGTLSGEGPFTVFAPTDAAFAALPAGTLDTLLADPSGQLTDILLYHVLGADVRSTDLSDGQVATTLLGKDITVTIQNDSVFINNALVTVADIVADNGVVHVIDAVLLPPATTSAILLTAAEVNVKIFPNPSSEVIFININDDNTQFDRINLWNMMGQKVYQADLFGDNINVNVQQFPAGTYLLQLIAGNKSYQERVLLN
jgi:hypothetical protein